MPLLDLHLSILPDYPKTEPGYAWFTAKSAARLVLAPYRKDLQKRTGLQPARVQIGAMRFRKWGLEDDRGRFLLKEKTSALIRVRACSIRCIENPEWGTFGVMEDCGTHFVIHGRSGSRVLHYTEADRHWEIVPPSP